MSRLDHLDDRFVPVVAAALRRLLDRLSAIDLRSRRQRLRQRVAGAGPLALIRSAPQVAALVAGLVFVVGALIAVQSGGSNPSAKSGTDPLPVGAALLTGVGPAIGQLAETYVADARRTTQRSTAQAPDRIQVGLVGLNSYLTPAQVVTLVGSLQVERVLLRPPVTGGVAEVLESPVSRVVPDLTALFARTVLRKRGDARDLKSTGDSILAVTKEESDFKAFYRAAQATAEQEIAAYQGACPCVFMLLVRGRARELQALQADPRVRVVEFAPVGVTTGQLVVTPLLPGATGPVRVAARSNATGR